MLEFTQRELEAIEAEDVANQERAAHRRAASPGIARERARKITMHALRERGELRAMVRDLEAALRDAANAVDSAEVRLIAIRASAECNHRLWQMRQLRRAAFGKQ